MTKAKDAFSGATIRTLRLKPITTVTSATPCAEAIETMREKGFDQLPVLSPPSSSSSGGGGGRLVGLVTLGNLLSYLASGRAGPTSPVRDVMFDFGRIPDVVTSLKDLDVAVDEKRKRRGRRPKQFVEITRDTPLSALSRFFEWNSAAVVTEKGADDGQMKPVAVVTKVDLLSWLVRQKRGEDAGPR